jgi:hypothetical protein
MRARILITACAVVLLAASSASLVHVPLHNPSNKAPLFWANPSSVGIVINSAGSDDIADGSHFTALRNAIDAWNRVPGSNAHLVENTSPAQQARRDWGSGVHLILFDENNSSGYFPLGSSTVAITPVYFNSNGKITDSDVLFNGSGFEFATDGNANRFDVQGVATHELGHFLGLDHSGFAGASMYPYVSRGLLAQRSLSLDDQHGMRDRYPSQSFGTITGTVRRASDNTVVKGAHVFARDFDGRSVGGALSSSTGVFRIVGLDAGSYSICATPLDFPVANANLTSGHVVQTDFESTIGSLVAVAAGATVAYGDLLVGADTALSIGRNSDELPLIATIGATTTHSLRGAGLGPGCSLQASDPLIALTPLFWSGSNEVTFQAHVPAGSAPGHVDVIVVNAFGQRSILPAGIEVTPPPPTVTNVAPGQSSDAGGTLLTLTGTRFNPGSRVVIGAEIYVDGAIGGCTVVDAHTITLTAAATSAGAYDVVVIDPSGVEGRLADGEEFMAVPAIESVFPLAGSALGGTQLSIAGSNFQDPMTVRIDGVVQTQVELASSSLLLVTTDAGVAGGPYVLELETPNAQIASAAFAYVAQSDPAIGALTPDSGASTGGNVLTLSGSNFNANTRVFFGVDAATGSGGTEADAVLVVDANTLEITVPAHAPGDVAVMVEDGATGQAALLASAFTFRAPSGSGGGGCYTVPSSDPWNWRDALAGSLWMLVVMVVLSLRGARSSRRAVLVRTRRD